MTTDQKASIALILGPLAGLVTMALHPTGHEIAASIAGGGAGGLNTFAHSLALFGQSLILMGTLRLTLRFSTHRDLAVAGYICFAMASVAILLATVASGFIATGLLQSEAEREGPSRDAISSALHYTSLINQSFAKVYVAFSSAAIVIWSLAMARGREFSRGLAVYGIVSGIAFLAGILSGLLPLDIHGFGSVVLGQAVWLIWAAMVLRRA